MSPIVALMRAALFAGNSFSQRLARNPVADSPSNA
jgi:hypothetical protein|tara:strand:- start:407 stop:511 length:105 start_codon:yes stop_codon:yes gene_type:complete